MTITGKCIKAQNVPMSELDVTSAGKGLICSNFVKDGDFFPLFFLGVKSELQLPATPQPQPCQI